MGPIGGLSARQFNSCLLRREEKREENTSATRELLVYLDGQRLRHECHPTYLGVTLDRTLSYRKHLTKTAGKLKNLNNLLMKLAGSTWGASANTAVICSSPLLFSSRVLRPSLVMLCSHKSGRCAVELYQRLLPLPYSGGNNKLMICYHVDEPL